MLYNIVRSINAWYPLGVLWLYVAGFVLAFSLMFVFPQGTLLLLFTGLAGLGLVMLMAKLLRVIEHRLVRRSTGLGMCPRCGTAHQEPAVGASSWRCAACGIRFGPSGDQII